MSETAPIARGETEPVTRAAVIEALRGSESFLLATHENPDGDALGSLVAMHGLLTALGKDSKMFMSAEEFPLPYEYRFFELDGLTRAIPEDLGERTIVFLDCGNIDRNPAQVLREGEPLINIDHHHDNTRFGTVNHVVAGASSTSEIVWDLMRELDVVPTLTVAEALYVGLVTDTGRFMYENTSPRAHVMAAELIAAGVDVDAIYRRLYEGVPIAKLELLSRALAQISRFDGGTITLARLTIADFEQTESEESYQEGIIDHLRAVAGTKVAVLVRDQLAPDRRGSRKVSLRATDGGVDVSRIARELGGGGHPRAAGFSTELELDELVAVLREAVAAQL